MTLRPTADGRRRLVGAVGIEFIKAQNPKELCGTCCSCKSFAVCRRNCYCPLVLASNFTLFFSQAKSFERLCYSPLAVLVTLWAYRCSSLFECRNASAVLVEPSCQSRRHATESNTCDGTCANRFDRCRPSRQPDEGDIAQSCPPTMACL
jgi:hypothetical protein